MFKKLVIAGSVLVASVCAQAQTASNSAELTVKGRILPAPCGLVLTGGGVADFGDLPNAVVKKWPISTTSGPARYETPTGQTKSVPLAVYCNAPAKFALVFTDNRITTVVPANAERFGLGQYAAPSGTAEPIGSYFLNYEDFLVQATAGGNLTHPFTRLINSAVPGPTWTTAIGNLNAYIPTGRSLAFAIAPIGNIPQSLTSVSGTLVVRVAPLQLLVDSATTAIEFNGSTTVTLLSL